MQSFQISRDGLCPTAEDFIRYINDSSLCPEGDAYVGIDPGVRNCGVFIVAPGGRYFCSTEDIAGVAHEARAIRAQMQNPVDCGRHAAQLLKTATGDILKWLAELQHIATVHIAIECVNIPESRDPTTRRILPASGNNYWAAGFSAMLTVFFGDRAIISAISPSAAKANLGLAPSGNHGRNKSEMLKIVQDELGILVNTNHEADALSVILVSAFPNATRTRIPGKRHATTKWSNIRPSARTYGLYFITPTLTGGLCDESSEPSGQN